MKTIVRALTLYQPWAWAVAAGLKTVENRKWAPWKGLLAPDTQTWIVIHAGATYEKAGELFLKDKGVALDPVGSRIKGAHLGVGRLVDCVTKSADPMFFGPYGWILRDLRLLEQPISTPGQMGLWELPPAHYVDVINQIQGFGTKLPEEPQQGGQLQLFK
jgi:hypothetical protein